MKININGSEYELNVERAVSDGYLTPIPPPYPLNAGDVYKRTGYSSQLLVNVAYGQDSWQLLGIGCRPNSNPFYRCVHTKDEIAAELRKDGYVFVKNIQSAVRDLVGNCLS